MLESLLGLGLEVDRLRVAPCLPADWPGFRLHYRYRETVYHIAVRQAPGGGGTVRVDGIEQPDRTIHLVDDRKEHAVEVEIAPAAGG